jgi:hypothetical protein
MECRMTFARAFKPSVIIIRLGSPITTKGEILLNIEGILELSWP